MYLRHNSIPATVSRHMKTDKKCVIALDLGTSAFKCGLVSWNGSLVASDIEKFDIDHKGKIYEMDFNIAFNRVIRLLKRICELALNKNYIIDALLITSQAQTFVPVDKDFKALSRGIVWLDSRAEKEAVLLKKAIADFARRAGFIRPLSELYATKILWLKQNMHDIFDRAYYFPMINEYIAYMLTGRFYSDQTNFGMSGVFDIRTKELNKDILELLDLSSNNFPAIKPACKIGYLLKLEIRKTLGLDKDIKVYLCGNDQSASAIGSGAGKEKEVSVNFGTAMVVYTLMPLCPQIREDSQIAGIAPMGGYFFLTYEARSGNIIDKVKKDLFPELTYDEFFSKYRQKKKKTELIWPENGWPDYSRFGSPDIAAASVTDYLIKRFQYHISTIEKYFIPEKIHISGGMAGSSVWTTLARDNCKYEIVVTNTLEAGLIGAYRIYKKTICEKHK